jgi:hypothetical protein
MTGIGVIQQPALGESRGRIQGRPVVAADDPLLSSHNERQRHGCFDPGNQNQRESFATQSGLEPALLADDSPGHEGSRQRAGGLGGASRVARAVRELYFPDASRRETAELPAHPKRETPAKVDPFGRAIREPGGCLNARSSPDCRAWLRTAARRNRREQPPLSGSRRWDGRDTEVARPACDRCLGRFGVIACVWQSSDRRSRSLIRRTIVRTPAGSPEPLAI